MINYSSIIYEALGYLGKALIVLGAFYLGRFWVNNNFNERKEYGLKTAGENRPKWWKLITLMLLILVFSIIMGSSLGTHTENADPLYGGGETVVDFQATKKQKYEYGITMFIVITIPALCGFYLGGKGNKNYEKNI